MKRLFFSLFSLFLFSSCSLSSDLFKGSLFEDDLSQIQPAQVTLSKSKVIMQLQSGISLVSFPFLSENDAADIIKNPAILRIWQEDDVSVLAKNQSYFIEVKEATEFSWNRAEETAYNSSYLQAGKNFPEIIKGEEQLLLSEIKLNGQNLLEAFASDYPPVQHFYVFGADKILHDLAKERVQDMALLIGGGIMIDSDAFSKLSWPLSVVMQKVVDAESAKQEKGEVQEQNKLDKEQEKYQKQVEKTFEKMDAELSKKIFDETKELPLTLLKNLKSKKESELKKLFSDRSLLAQVHAFSDIQASQEVLDMQYWEERNDLFRPFSVLTSKGFDTINTPNRSIIFVEFPYTKEELKEKGGATAFYEGIAFIRGKDCNWKFDPVETSRIASIFFEQSRLYDAKSLKKLLETKIIELSENEDFSVSREMCKPALKGVLEYKKGKYIDLASEGDSAKPDSKLLKNHESNCEKFASALQKFSPEVLQESIQDNEDEPKITVTSLNISFSEDVCLQVWSQLIGREDLLASLNGEDSADEELSAMIIDDALVTFLGGIGFSCSKLSEDSQKDACYFGNALMKEAATSCKKMNSQGLQYSCAAMVAMSKKDPKQCEKVFGTFDPKADKDNLEKQSLIRNCQLDAIVTSAKDTKECKQFKKRFLFFFHLSTPSSKLCESYVKKEKKLTTWTSALDEDAILEEMGISMNNE